MNRRKAITRIVLAGAGVTAAVGGYKWYSVTKEPDLAFIDSESELIAALAETIIPATDTPGAKECGVEKFIQQMIKGSTDRKTQNKFINGLKDVKSYALSKYDKLYQQCTPEQQISIMEHFASGGSSSGLWSKIERRYLGNSFFTTLKQYTVEGYCTSRKGATQALSYLPVPGRYEGCIPLTTGQKAWATS
jgi:hypothetical protein